MNCENCRGPEEDILQGLTLFTETVKGESIPVKRKTLFGEKIIGYQETKKTVRGESDEVCYCCQCGMLLIKDYSKKSGTRVAKLSDLFLKIYQLKNLGKDERKTTDFTEIDLGSLVPFTLEGKQAIDEAKSMFQKEKENEIRII